MGEGRTHCDVPALAIGGNVCDGGLVPGVLREVVVDGCIVHQQIVAVREEYSPLSAILHPATP